MCIIWVEELLMEETICNSPIIVVTDASEKQLETFCFENFMNLLNEHQVY